MAAPGSVFGQRDDVGRRDEVHRRRHGPRGRGRIRVERGRVDRHDDDGRRQRDAQARLRARRGPGRSVRNAASRPGAPTTWMDAGSSPMRPDATGVRLAAHEVQVAQLRDRVAEGVVEGTERLLAAVEVDDRDAIDRGRQRGGGRLEPIADEDERIDRAWPAAAPRRRRGRRRPGHRPAGRTSPSSQRNSASGSKPSARTWSTVWPCRADRCVPPTHRTQLRGPDAPGWPRRCCAGCPSPGDRSSGRRWAAAPRRGWAVIRRPPRRRARPSNRRPWPAGRSGRRGSRPRRARARSPVAGRPGRPSATVAPAARSCAQCRLRRATAAIARSASTGTFSPVPSAEVTVRMPATIRVNSSGSSEVALVRARHRPIEGQVLLDERRADGGRGEGEFRAGRVVRPAGRHAERPTHRLDGPQVGILGAGRVAGHAMEQGQRRIAGRARSHPPPRRPRRGRPSRSTRASGDRAAASAAEERQVRELARARP